MYYTLPENTAIISSHCDDSMTQHRYRMIGTGVGVTRHEERD